ncbi:MAG: glycosyltransferase [archaeon]|nr:glycosyltransferase [archaeon]
MICINDGSTDSSLKILEKYKSMSDKLKVITQENHGLGHARNRGLEIAKGEYMCFLDGDDWLAK